MNTTAKNTGTDDTNMENAVQVHILVSLETLAPLASTVCERLASRFGLTSVVVRSAIVPSHQLTLESTERPMLYAVLGPSTSATSTLESESSIPIITLPPSSADPDDTALAIARCCSLASYTLRCKVQQVVLARRQARMVQDAQWKTESYLYRHQIAQVFDRGLQITGDKVRSDGASWTRARGKVRDRYTSSSSNKHVVALVTTDRQSGFDRALAQVPFKGAVLNLTSAFWFEQTQHIIPNHVIQVPHPYVTVAKVCQPFPIEFVVRSYLTGSTSTSIWKHYQSGVRNYCGHDLPDGMTKNQALPKILLTPTTKEDDHDRPISAADIVKEEWMTQGDFDVCAQAAMKIFAVGQEIAARRGLILVDTKYEFGKDTETGEIRLIDEVHTPDSSRYWLASTYEERLAEGKEPDNIDKEFLRLWFREHCDPYKDKVLPQAPRELVLELSRRYILLYELISGRSFDFDRIGASGEASIQNVLEEHL